MKFCDYGDWRDDFIYDTQSRSLFLDRLSIEPNPEPGRTLRMVHVHTSKASASTETEAQPHYAHEADSETTYEIVCRQVESADIEQVYGNGSRAIEARMHQANRESMCELILQGWRPDLTLEQNWVIGRIQKRQLIGVLQDWLRWIRDQLTDVAEIVLLDMNPITLQPIAIGSPHQKLDHDDYLSVLDDFELVIDFESDFELDTREDMTRRLVDWTLKQDARESRDEAPPQSQKPSQ